MFFVVALEPSKISFDVRATELCPWIDAYCVGSGIGSAVSRCSLGSVRVRDTVARRVTTSRAKFRLGDWVSVQRYRKDLLSVERKRRLNAIGFVWDWREYLWEQNFVALLKFKRREGHCCVPTFHREDDFKLGWWVATQRRNRKEMSPERSARLNRVGFVWSPGSRWGGASAR